MYHFCRAAQNACLPNQYWSPSDPTRFSSVRGATIQYQGGGWSFCRGQIIYFTRLGGALKIANCITCLYRTVLEVNYLFNAESARNYLFQIGYYVQNSVVTDSLVQCKMVHLKCGICFYFLSVIKYRKYPSITFLLGVMSMCHWLSA